jgi:hypothetical protein
VISIEPSGAGWPAVRSQFTAAICPGRLLGGWRLAVMMPLIHYDQALEFVRDYCFRSKCAKPTQEQWDLLTLHSSDPDRFPMVLKKKLERATFVRALMSKQDGEADWWLRKHQSELGVKVEKSADGDIRAVQFDSDKLENLLRLQFGHRTDQRLAVPDVKKMLTQYLSEAAKPNQKAAIEYIEAAGKSFDREHARDSYKELVGRAVLKRGRPSS